MSLRMIPLKRKENFERVRRVGKSLKGDYLKISMASSEELELRFGIIVSKKVSNLAVQRNKLRRQIKAIIQELFKEEEEIRADVVIIVSKQALEASYEKLADEIKKLLIGFGIIKGR